MVSPLAEFREVLLSAVEKALDEGDVTCKKLAVEIFSCLLLVEDLLCDDEVSS